MRERSPGPQALWIGIVMLASIGFAMTPVFVRWLGLGGAEPATIALYRYGLTAALYGEISIENGAVKQGNFHDYGALRMDRAPVIETHIINSMEHWGGAGEPGTPGSAPALTNAIFAATGIRIRELPVARYELGPASA